MNNSSHFRKKRIYFSQVSNLVLRDCNLSLKAKGLYALIQSYITIENFTLYKNTLKKQCKEGEKSFESGWKELKDTGYLLQEKHKNPDGTFYYIYDLLDEPNHTPKKEGVDKVGCGKGGLYNNTDLNNTDLSKPLYKGEEQTDVLKDVPKEELEFIDEATILLEEMPNKEGFTRFPLAYSDKRKIHSKDELFRTVDRYIESVKLLGRDMVVGCANFFSREHYIEFLDVNWENTLDNINKQIERRKFNKDKNRTKAVNEPEGLEEWSEGIDDVFKND